jgi:hypothetical protein
VSLGGVAPADSEEGVGVEEEQPLATRCLSAGAELDASSLRRSDQLCAPRNGDFLRAIG